MATTLLAAAPVPALADDWQILGTAAVGVATPAAQPPDFYEPWWPQAENRAVGTLGATLRYDFGETFIGLGLAGRLENSSTEYNAIKPGLSVRGGVLPEGAGRASTYDWSLKQQGIGQIDLHVGVHAGDYNIVLGGGALLDRYRIQSTVDYRNVVLSKQSLTTPENGGWATVDNQISVGAPDAYMEADLDTLRFSPMIFTAIERRLTDRLLVSLRGQVSLQGGSISGSSNAGYSVNEYVLENGVFVPAQDSNPTKSGGLTVGADLQPQGSLMLGLSFRLN